MRTKRLYRIMLLAAAAGTLALVLLGYGFDVLKRTELSTVDMRFDVRGERDAPDELVFVKIDDETFNDLDTTFPLPRQLHARVIDNIKADGAKTIAYDVQFTEPSDDPDADNALIESVRAAGNVVLATTEVDENGKTRIFGGDEGLEYSKGRPANSLFPNDPGGVFRRMEFEIDGLETFAMAAAEVFRGREIEPPGGETRLDRLRRPAGDRRGRLVRQGAQRRVPAGDLQGQDRRGRRLRSARSRTCTRPRPHPATSRCPGPRSRRTRSTRCCAASRSTPAPGFVDVLLIVLLGARRPAAGAADQRGQGGARDRSRWSRCSWSARSSSSTAGTIVTVVYPLIAAGLAAAATVILVRDHHRVRARAHPRRVRALRAGVGGRGRCSTRPTACASAGSRAESTVLFSDLRGFTSFAEPREPDEVIEILNRYLTAMSDAILDNGGTLVAYMGDGIMAVFGAPIEQPDHADRALAAARDMLAPARRASTSWLRERGPRRGVQDGDRPEHRPRDVRQRRLGAPARVHGDRRHHQHRRAARGDDQGDAVPAVPRPTRRRRRCTSRPTSSRRSASSRSAAARRRSACGPCRARSTASRLRRARRFRPERRSPAGSGSLHAERGRTCPPVAPPLPPNGPCRRFDSGPRHVPAAAHRHSLVPQPAER